MGKNNFMDLFKFYTVIIRVAEYVFDVVLKINIDKRIYLQTYIIRIFWSYIMLQWRGDETNTLILLRFNTGITQTPIK